MFLNSITAASPKFWSKIMGIKLYKTNVFMSLGSTIEQATLSLGQKVDRPYRADVVTESYTKGSPANVQDLTATSDELTVDVARTVRFYVDSIDKIQNKYDLAEETSTESATRLANDIDAWFLYEAVNAATANQLDDGTFGGTTGAGVSLAVTNIIDVYGKINERLDLQNVPENDRVIAISPNWKNILWQYVQGKFSALGDRTGEFGNIGTYAGLKHYVSNNLTAETVISVTGTPSDGDTITIDGVTFTAKTTIGTTAGNVLIGGSAANFITNLAALINAGGVTSDSGVSNVSLTTANQRAVSKWVAVGASSTITVRIKGRGYLTSSLVSKSGTNLSIDTTKITQLIYAAKKGSTDIVIQKQPSVDSDKGVAQGYMGMFYMALALFGIKTFNQGKNQIVVVRVATANL